MKRTLNTIMFVGTLILIGFLFFACAVQAQDTSGNRIFLPVAAGGDGSGVFIPNEGTATPEPTSTPVPTQVPDVVWATQWDVYDAMTMEEFSLPFYIPTAEEWCNEPGAWIIDLVIKGAVLDICGRDPSTMATNRDWMELLGDDGWEVVDVDFASIQLRSDGYQAVSIQAGHSNCEQIDDVWACGLSFEPVMVGWYNQFWGENYNVPVYLTPEAQGGPVGEPTPIVQSEQDNGTIPLPD